MLENKIKMNSIPEERNIILQENIPKLITNLTGFKASKKCMI